MKLTWMAAIALLAAACSSGDGGATSGSGAGASAGSGAGGAGAGGSDAGTGDTWASYAQGFFATYCVECHNPSDAARDYNKLADVQKDAPLVSCGVATTKLAGCGSFPPPKQFPIDDATKTNPKPSDAERARIVAWIAAGLP